jgi:hypothetical protein
LVEHHVALRSAVAMMAVAFEQEIPDAEAK